MRVDIVSYKTEVFIIALTVLSAEQLNLAKYFAKKHNGSKIEFIEKSTTNISTSMILNMRKQKKFLFTVLMDRNAIE